MECAVLPEVLVEPVKEVVLFIVAPGFFNFSGFTKIDCFLVGMSLTAVSFVKNLEQFRCFAFKKKNFKYLMMKFTNRKIVIIQLFPIYLEVVRMQIQVE